MISILHRVLDMTLKSPLLLVNLEHADIRSAEITEQGDGKYFIFTEIPKEMILKIISRKRYRRFFCKLAKSAQT